MVYLDWLQAVLESNARCAWKWQSSDLRDTLRGWDWVSLEVQMEIEIEWVQRCTGKPGSSEFGDALWGRDGASFDMLWEAIIDQVCRCTLRPWSSEFRDALWGRNRGSRDEYMEPVDGRRAGCWDSFHQFVNSQPWECDNVTLTFSGHGERSNGGRSCREARRKLKLHSGVNS